MTSDSNIPLGHLSSGEITSPTPIPRESSDLQKQKEVEERRKKHKKRDSQDSQDELDEQDQTQQGDDDAEEQWHRKQDEIQKHDDGGGDRNNEVDFLA